MSNIPTNEDLELFTRKLIEETGMDPVVVLSRLAMKAEVDMFASRFEYAIHLAMRDVKWPIGTRKHKTMVRWIKYNVYDRERQF